MAIALFFLPMFAVPLVILAWFFWGGPSPWVFYAFVYNWPAAITVGIVLLLLLVWLEGFNASIDEAPTLVDSEDAYEKRNWLWRYYRSRNKSLIDAFKLFQHNADEDDLFGSYLQIRLPDLYRKYTVPMSFMPDWMMIQSVTGHARRGHTRFTRNGPVEVRSHQVREHSRIKRR